MKKLTATCLLGIAGAVHAAAPNSSIFESVYASQDVALDTTSYSAFWQGAEPIYLEKDVHGNLVPHHRTEVRSRWTKDNLYLLFVCPYEDLYLKPAPNTVSETNELWKWDVAELFIGSNFQNIRRYKEFELSPQAEWIDLDINLDTPHHEDGWVWNSGFQVSARIDSQAKIWYGAMRIPFAAIGQRSPADGRIFRANLFRSQGPPDRKKSITWKAPMTETFHTPERFGELKLVKRK
ncbi:MAG: carbohydrate-binding family 9-like protein [Edaphobacter sp.]